MASRRAITGKAITGQAVTGVETDETMPDYNQDQFEWEGSCWALVSDPDLEVALVLPGGDKSLQEEFAARLANILRLNVENLYVTDTAVINEAVIAKLFADLFTANKIGADQIAANSIDVSKLRVTDELAAAIANFIEINAEQINSGSFGGGQFTGGEFLGAVVIGGSIATSRYPSRDGGVHIGESTGIRAWNSSGQQTIAINGSSNFLSGTISTGRSGQPAAILTPVVGGGGQVGGGVWFSEDGSLGNDQAAIYSYLDGNIHIRPKDSVPKGTVFIDGNLNVGSRTWFQNQVEVGGLQSNGNVTVGGTSARRSVTIYGDLRATHPGTGSSSSNAVYMGDGQLVIEKSSRRYKKNIADWNPEPERVLGLQPRQWQHDDPDQPDHPNNLSEAWNVGFIAEEVDELGLDLLVKYAGDGKGGWRPDALNYDRFAAAHQVVLQKHDREIKELRAENEELRSRLATIESLLLGERDE